MKTLKQTSQFKKDLKRIQNQPLMVERLGKVLRMLRNEESLPASYRTHPLFGNYRGCMECHVESDSLLIWIDNNSDTIKLLRFGSHSEVF